MTYLFIPTLLLALNLHADLADPPEDFGAREKAEWAMAPCKWRIGKAPVRAGWVISADRRECFAIAKYNAIAQDQVSTATRDVRTAWRDDVVVIYDRADGRREVCRLSPARERYEAISWDEVTDAIGGGAEVMDRLLRRLDANLTESCS